MDNMSKSTKWMFAVLIAAHILTIGWVVVNFGFVACFKIFSVPYIWVALTLILYKITFTKQINKPHYEKD